MSTPIVLDCDPGHDDAIALLLALASPEIDVRGVTTVAGNSELSNTTRNALTVLEVAGRPEVPVAAGCERPLVKPLRTAAHVHGESGLEGPTLDPPSIQPIDAHAVDFIAEVVSASSEPVTLVPVGPLTNIAMLLRRYPQVRDGIERIVLMGGAVAEGNTTPSAEFNIWVDPHAADIVFRSGIDLTMIGLDVTHQARMGADHGRRLREAGRCGAFVADLLDFFVEFHARVYGMDSSPVHDAVAVAHVIWPDLVHTEHRAVEVETSSALTLGRTVVDLWGVTDGEPNVHVGFGLDGSRFADSVIDRISQLP